MSSADRRRELPAESPASAKAALLRFWQSSSPVYLLLLLTFCAFWRTNLAAFTTADALVIAGLLLWWPMNEWLIHTQILHRKPIRVGKWLFDLPVARSHREHHKDPFNFKHVFIPRHIYLLALVAVAAGLYWAPQIQLLWTFFTAYFLLGLHYEWVHYLAHIRYRPKLYAGRIREHRLHHFRHEQNWWGVSTGIGDRLMGTAPDAAAVSRSKHTSDILAG